MTDKAGQAKAVLSGIQNGILEIRGEVIMTKKVFRELNRKYEKEGKPVLANPRNGAAGSIRQLDPALSAERKLSFYAYELSTELGLDRHEQKGKIAGLFGLRILNENKYCPDLSAVEAFHDHWEKFDMRIIR